MNAEQQPGRRRLWAVAGSGATDEPSTDVAVTAAAPDASLEQVVQQRPGPALSGLVVAHQGDLRPIVPPWMRTPEGRRKTVRWWIRRRLHLVQLHLFWLPAYVLRVLVRAPRGAGRIATRLYVWALDTRADAMEQELASAGRAGVGDYLRLREDRSLRVRTRLVLLGVVALVAAAALVAAMWWLGRTPTSAGPDDPHRWWLGWPLRAVLAVAVLLVLARVGTDPDKPLVEHAVVTVAFRELTPAIVMRALKAAGLGGAAAKVSKTGEVLEEDTRPGLLQPIQRAENGSGWLAMLALPYGRTVEDAANARDRLASGLDVDEGQVVIEAVPGSKRRMALFVSDVDPFTQPPHRTPLAKAPQTSVWRPARLGAEPRGREIRPTLLFNSFLVGAVPRSGKTFAGRLLVAPALLDPQVDVVVIDLKGGRDWKAAELLATTYISGDEPEDLAYAVATLERERSDARARFAAFRDLPDEQCPESKLTPELAAQGMRSRVIVIDEVQNLLTDPTHKKAALALLVWLAKTAPAAGWTQVLLTQRPATDVIPSDLRDNTSVRLALRTMTWQGSDAILGANAASTGWSTANYLDSWKGAAVERGIPNGRGGDFANLRVDLLGNEDFTRICQVGRQRRIDAGTLSRQALGETDDVRIVVSVVEDCLKVWPAGRAKVHGAELLGRLQQLRELYAPLDQTALTRTLQAAGVPAIQAKVDGVNRQGYELVALQKAAAAALPAPDPEPADEVEP